MPLSPFLSAESLSDREFQWQRASQGSETTNHGQCDSPGVGASGHTELGWEDVAEGAGGGKCPMAAGIGSKDGKGPASKWGTWFSVRVRIMVGLDDLEELF